ncbi:hypothetical protein CK203_018125 [Vitis vinifera]|uniref:Uncharacterized protein n=1 Tax=Vitis vinifera TaxID=29760 RepID=A0A438GGF1_VITVI|nr:hypothetical protein CK203_062698 [Vitis vinifera]RVX10711.1 hypothetical protein CK203_018125 [Vitis vinifera]
MIANPIHRRKPYLSPKLPPIITEELCVDACRVYGQSSKFGQETDGRVVDLMLGIWDAVSDDDLSSMPITRAGHGPYASLRCPRNTILLQANGVWMVFK